MSRQPWWQRISSAWTRRPGRRKRARRPGAPLQLEALEDRLVPSSIVVTTNSDAVSHTGVSLRDAVAKANTDAVAGNSDTITFNASLTGETITLSQGSLVLSGSGGTITIDGSVAAPLTISGGGAAQDFVIGAHVTAIIQNLTISGGSTSGDGGGIGNMGNLTLNNCIITGNTAGDAGGGVWSSTSGLGENFASLSPLIDQVFFVGDGLTGTGTGAVQQFLIPDSATSLILGIADSGSANGGPPGSYQDNDGTFSVTADVNGSLLSTATVNASDSVYNNNGFMASGSTNPTVITLPPGTGRVLTLSSVTGSITENGSNYAGPDGGSYFANPWPGIDAANGISGIAAANVAFLSAVFLNGQETGNQTPPPTLDFSSAGGTLAVSNCVISHNTASGASALGGGLFNTGTATITDSTFNSNGAFGGGGICNNNTLTLTASTVSNNTAEGATSGGAGLEAALASTTTTITNSTFCANAATGTGASGGAIEAWAPVTVLDCTIADNSSQYGGGIDDETGSAQVTIGNTLLAFNTAQGSGPDFNNAANSLGGNLIDNTSSSTGWIASDLQNQTPVLGPLQNNGGPTSTMALLVSSPGAGAGLPSVASSAGLTTDQRGLARTVNGLIDIGAYENQLPAITLTSATGNGTTYYYVNWTSANPSGGTASGTITLPDGSTVNVTFTCLNSDGSAGNFMSAQINGQGYNYWTPTSTWTSATVQNAPPNPDIIQLVGGQNETYVVTLSQPIVDPIMAVLSLGGSNTCDYDFNAPFTILSQGPSSTFGGGDTKLTQLPGNVLQGQEGDGTIQFLGTFATFSWTVPVPETWHGFTFGIQSTQLLATTNVTEGQTATNTGTFGDTADSNVTLTASVGTITQSTGNAGTWSWSMNTTDASQTQTVTITATDTTGATATTTFPLVVSDAPLTDTTPVQSDNANVGSSTGQLVLATFSDANPAALASEYTASVNWGGTVLGAPAITIKEVSSNSTASTWEVLGSATYTQSGTFAVAVTVADSGGETVTTSNTTLSVANLTLAFTTQPDDNTAGNWLGPVTVQELDGFNPVPGATVTISLSSDTLNGTATATTNASGNAVFTNLTVAAAGTYTLAASTGSLNATSNSFDITVPQTTTLLFTTQPKSEVAGSGAIPTVVQVLDQMGNIMSGVVLSYTISPGTLTGVTTATTGSTGLASFSLTGTAAGTFTLTATSGAVNTTSNQFIISPGALSKLLFTTEPPATMVVGTPFGSVVQVTDVYGNAIAGAAVTLTPSAGTLNGTKAVTSDVSGNATFAGLTIDTPGTGYTLTATAGTLTVKSTSFNVSVGALTSLSFTVQPLSTTAGSTLGSVTVKATDSFGNLMSGVSVNVSVTGALKGTTPLTTNASGLAVYSDLSINQIGTYTLSAASGTITAASQSFILSPAAAAQLAYTIGPVGTTAGLTLATVALAVTDKFNNPVPNVVVTLTSTLGANTPGTLSGTTSILSNATGVAAFSTLSIKTAGTYTLTASATGLASVVSGSFTIAPAGATKLSFVAQPRSVIAGAVQTVSVQALDPFGNPVPGVNIGSLTLSPTVTLNNFAATATTAGGLAALSGLSVNIAGTYTMTATGGGLTTTSTPFVISAAPASVLSFVNQPGTTSAGSVIGPLTVGLWDSFGNPLANTTVRVALAGGSFSSGTIALATNAAGEAVFSNLITNKVGSYTLSLSTASLPSVSSKSFNVISAAPMLSFVTQPVNASAGVTLRTVTIRATDKFGNVIAGLPLTLALSSGVLAGATAAVTDATGLASFSTLSVIPAGSGYALTATSGSTSVRSNAFNIIALPIASLTFVTQPAGTTAGSNLGPVTVLAHDVNSHLVLGETVTISFSSGQLRGTLSAVTNAEGDAIFSTLSENVAGTFTLRAAFQAVSTTSSSFTITAAAAAKLTFATQPAGTAAGSSIKGVSVLVTDKFGNVVPDAAVSIGLSSAPGAYTPGSLTSGTTTVASDAKGRAAFSDLVEDTAGTYALIATSAGATNAASSPFAIVAGAASQLFFLTQPGNGKAGVALSRFVVEAKDQFGNVVPRSGTVITVSDGTLRMGPYVTSTLGQAVIANWTEILAGTHTVTATAPGLTGAVSNSFSIAPGAGLLSFVAGAGQNATAGSVIGPVTVRVADRFGNVLPGVAIAVSIVPGSGAGTAASRSGAVTLTTDATGQAVFSSLTETLAGPYSLLATATGIGSLKSKSFTVAAAPAVMLSFTAQPQNISAGSNLGTVTAELCDPFGNVVTTAGTPVTVAVSSGVLKGTTTASTVSSGRAIFNTLSETTAGTYSFLATSGSLTATSRSFVVTPGSSRRLTFLVQPAAAQVAGNLGAVTVQVDDAYGNPITGQTVSVYLTTSTAALNGPKSAVTNAQGDAIFSALAISGAGTFTLTASDLGMLATSSPFTISAG